MEIKPTQVVTPEYTAPTYTPCGPWISSYDLFNPWQVVWNNISFAPDPYQQMFNFQDNRYGPGLQRRTYKFDPGKTYNITLIQGDEYAYFTYGGFYDNTTISWVPIQYVGTALSGVVGSDLGATSIYDYTQDYPNGLYHNDSKYRMHIKRDVPPGTEITMVVFDGQQTINYHTRVEVPTFTIESITDEDTLLHFYSRDIEFRLNFQNNCQIDGYGGAYTVGIKFNVEIIQGQEYGNLYYPGTVTEPEQFGKSITNLEDEYGQGISNYSIKYKADGVQPDINSPGIVTIRCSANDMDILPVEISFPIKYNEDPPDEGGSIIVNLDKENYRPGDTAIANCKWLTGYNELIEFPAEQRFTVEITGCSEYGTLQDPITGETSNILQEVSNGFRVITAEGISEDSVKIILKGITSVGGDLPTVGIRKGDSSEETERSRKSDKQITPEVLVIGGDEIVGYGTVIIKKDECGEEIVVCENLEPQVFPENVVKILRENDPWQWIDNQGNSQTTSTGAACQKGARTGCDKIRFGVTYVMQEIGKYSSTSQKYLLAEDININPCLDQTDPNHERWLFDIENIRVPIFSAICPLQPNDCGWKIDLLDGTNEDTLSKYITNYETYKEVIKAVDWWVNGPYTNDKNQNYYYKLNIKKYYFSSGLIAHEYRHILQKDSCLRVYMNSQNGMSIFRKPPYILTKDNYQCPEEVIEVLIKGIKPSFKGLILFGTNLNNFYKVVNDIPEYEIDADNYARTTYNTIKSNIQNWAKNQSWFPK